MLAGYAKAIALAAVAVSAALVLSIFAVPFITSPTAIGNTDGMADARRIVVIAEAYADNLVFKNVKASDSEMQANSMQLISDPFGRSMRAFYDRGINGSASEEVKRAWLRDIDAQEKYMLVRLPEWLGGSENDLSSYRVFSAFDVAGQCSIRYHDNITVILDPCSGNGYRIWDGLALHGVASYGASGAGGSLFSSSILALPQLRLGIDNEGYVVAYKLDNTLNGDGAVGEGRRLASRQLEQSNEKMIQTASKHAGFKLPFPATVPSAHLIWMTPGEEDESSVNLFYLGRSFEGYEGAFSSVYQPRPLSNSYSSYRITVFLNETSIDESQAKAIFDDLLGTTSPECEQGCKFVVKQGDGMIARVNTEAEADALNAQALAWGKAGDQDVMAAVEGINSDMEELLSIVASLDDYGL